MSFLSAVRRQRRTRGLITWGAGAEHQDPVVYAVFRSLDWQPAALAFIAEGAHRVSMRPFGYVPCVPVCPSYTETSHCRKPPVASPELHRATHLT